MNLHLAHGQFCIQALKTFPNHSLTIKPEWRLGQARLQLHQQISVPGLIVVLLKEPQSVGR
ncbi:hypothetical protein D3C87_1828330 [compost metagenome]